MRRSITLAALMLLTMAAVATAEQITVRLHGSNTVGATLAPTLATAYLRLQGVENVERLATGENEVQLQGRGERATYRFEIQSHGSSTGFRSLAAGGCDIAMASRPVKDSEVASLRSLGDMRSPQSEHILGLDGIAIIVHPENPLDGLPLESIRSLFSGRTRTWNRVGGTTAPVDVYARDDRSGTFETFQKLVLGEARLDGDAQRYESNAELSYAVAEDPAGVGFVGIPYILESKALKVADGDVPPMHPTNFSVGAEDYPLARRLYLYTPSEPASPTVTDFIEFCQSAAGQRIVAAEGFVDQLVHESPSEVAARYQDEQGETFNGFMRLSTTFRFKVGEAELDNRALRDAQRVAYYLLDTYGVAPEVLLVGYSDSVGDPAQNRRLSLLRAISAEVQLIANGVQPTRVIGLGDALPVANNDSFQGRARNRRVEVWVRPRDRADS